MSQHAPPPDGDLVQRIQERYSSLRKSERVVADYLRENAGKRLDYSITEFAQILELSEATVSRVSRALGYSGFPDLKLSLAQGAASHSRFSNIPAEIDEADPLITTSVKLADILAQSIQGTQRMLNAEQLDTCIAVLRGARRIVFVGVGGAAAICDEAAHLFIKAGLEAVAYNDAYTQVIAASNVTSDCVMVGISHTGTTQDVANALTLAAKNGASTIAITSDASSPVALSAQTVLTTWNATAPLVPLYGDFLEGRVGQLYLVSLLYIGLIFIDHGERADRLHVTTEALERYYKSMGGG